mmetsp:Transcript_26723/g.41916  ORF Transcript_26723/g.41916 Transcript_26723/m.41916 type:complete len:835 (+) Transcript_26723:212-2716(+)|eukprot:CAMPEP_0201714754 /NCGR_PEP_ID=MMETSP0593-20130828/1094_1 /ASSEMBLY_ACC=CAM_ASM_000672 /TAXON_ID=267983 /ORGANISM="Skeletonema japonicum, Strain CCMP2506" /LENGTH=834 /DNA_ID=CAMNT_0048204057 /DNA_START=88 /DNA_END=2592 /DNA_ORIENTATION=-
MNDVAYNTGMMFSNPTAPTDSNRDSDEDLNGHIAALASSGYNLSGMTNSTGNLQLMNSDLLLGAIGNQLVGNSNIIQAPPVQDNQAPPATNFGSFLFNPLAMFYQQQQPTVPQQMQQAAPLPNASAVALADAAAAATLPHQSIQYITPSHSPMPQAFFTPQSGTPNPPTPPPAYDVNQDLGLTTSLPQSFAAQTAANNQENITSNKRKAPDKIVPPKSLIRQGISSVGSALGVVATYINKSLLSGIPFHIADRAMKDSKQTYSKWWDQTVHDGNGEGDERSRKGSTDDEYMDDDSDDGLPVRKKRKTVVDNEYGKASSLSKKLAGNYNGADIEAFKKNWRVGKSEVVESQASADAQVDSSIIGPPRRKANASSGGYDTFNSVGSMYGGDIYSSNALVESKSTAVDSSTGNYSLSYDSLSGYYMNSTEEDERKLAAIPTPPTKNVENDTIGNNTLGHTLQAIKEIIDEKNRDSEEQEIFQMSFKNPRDWVTKTIRSELIDALQCVQGDVTAKRFTSSLEVLSRFYKASGRDARANPWGGGRGSTVGGPAGADLLEGSWLNISRPNYVECLGQNAENDFMYTLGRMSFDIFQPSNLICSVQSTHNTIKMIGEREELPACVPNSLKEEVALLCNSRDGDSASKRPFLRSYDIAISMTIEPPSLVGQPEPTTTPSPTKRMRAVMSVKGYILPDPETKNRLTVWFTGGSLSPAKLSSSDGDKTDDEEENTSGEGNEFGGFDEWNSIFGKGKWRKALSERARGMAAKVLLGVDAPSKMEDDGELGYSMNRPVGGHGKAYIDVLYLDDDLLIMKGHHGTIYAMARSCVSQRYRNLQAAPRT